MSFPASELNLIFRYVPQFSLLLHGNCKKLYKFFFFCINNLPRSIDRFAPQKESL